jgi:hypothetical protein
MWTVPEDVSERVIADLEATEWWLGGRDRGLLTGVKEAWIAAARECGETTTRQEVMELLETKGHGFRARPGLEWFPKKFVDE